MNTPRKLQVLAVAVLALVVAASARADVTCDPDPLGLTDATTTGDVVVKYAHTESLYGYSIDVVWDDTVVTAVFARPDIGPFNTTEFFQVVNLGAGHVRIDAAIGGAHAGITDDELFKITFTTIVDVFGTSDITLTIEDMYDPDWQTFTFPAVDNGQVNVVSILPSVTNVLIVNTTLAHTSDYVKTTDAITVTATVTDDSGFVGGTIEADLSGLGGSATAAPDSYDGSTATWNIASATCSPSDGTLTVTVTATDVDTNTDSDSDTIIADNIAPAVLANLSVTPGDGQIHLSWDDIAAGDANPYGVRFQYNAWGDYPAYDTVAPAYPADHTAGTLATEATSGTSADWVFATRDIYYVAGFVFDQALNFSAGDVGAQGRATNYWLGDVGSGVDGSGPPDGEITPLADIYRLGETYALIDTDPGFDAECNVGPTEGRNRLGIPLPNDDNEVGFEDMMVFALNYTVVTPGGKHTISGKPVLAWHAADGSTWVLELLADGGGLQGLNLRADLPAGVSCTVAKGDLLLQQGAPSFLSNAPQRGLDAGLAVFGGGVGISGTGELVRVTFSEPLSEVPVVVTARDLNNDDIEVTMAAASDVPLPTLVSFAQNYPNPFNPQTKLAFELPRTTHVTLVVYGLDGAQVRQLVDAERGPGRHEVTWDGRDDTGRPVATGTYIARMEAGEFEQIRKMVLMK